jgi:hypothetical protein
VLKGWEEGARKLGEVRAVGESMVLTGERRGGLEPRERGHLGDHYREGGKMSREGSL